jgi:hypothetical protein
MGRGILAAMAATTSLGSYKTSGGDFTASFADGLFLSIKFPGKFKMSRGCDEGVLHDAWHVRRKSALQTSRITFYQRKLPISKRAERINRQGPGRVRR